MSITTVLLIVKVSLLIVGLMAYFWKDIRTFLNGTVRNRIENTFGKVWGDRFAKFLVKLDRGMMIVRKFVQMVMPNFLGMKPEISGKITKTTVKPVKLPLVVTQSKREVMPVSS